MHWEHSRRRHGLWSDNGERIAYIGLSPPVTGEKTIYSWSIDGSSISGEENSLRKAKRQVSMKIALTSP